MNKQILERYAALKIELKKIENEIEFLQPEVLKEILIIRGDSTQPILVQDFGTYSIMRKKIWSYSPLVKDLELAWKERQKLEQQMGQATFKEIEILTFREQNEGSEG